MGFMDAFKNFMTSPESDYIYEEEDNSEVVEKRDREETGRTAEVEEVAPRRPFGRDRLATPPGKDTSTSNVIGMASALGISQIYMMEPRHFDEMSDAVKALHERKTVVLNMTLMEPDQAQRSVDFVAGATHALGGDLERVGDSIFIFAPSNVQLTTPSSHAETHIPKPRPNRSAVPAWESEPVSRFARS